MSHEKTVSESRIWTPLGALGSGWNRKKKITQHDLTSNLVTLKSTLPLQCCLPILLFSYSCIDASSHWEVVYLLDRSRFSSLKSRAIGNFIVRKDRRGLYKRTRNKRKKKANGQLRELSPKGRKAHMVKNFSHHMVKLVSYWRRKFVLSGWSVQVQYNKWKFTGK